MVTAITGASGHIGAHLVRLLIAQGQSVRALVRRNTKPLDGLACETVKGDLLDRESLTSLCSGASTVFHLGGVISLQGDQDGHVHSVNVTGTQNIVQAAIASNVETVVLCSSIQAFEARQADSKTIDETSPRPTSRAPAYDRSKWTGEQTFLETAGDHIKAVIVNPTGVIGPWDFAPSRMGQFFLDLAANRLPFLVHGGADWVDVRDVSSGIVAAARTGEHQHNYILGGQNASLRELSQLASQFTQQRTHMAVVPIALARLGLPFAALMNRLRRQEPAFTGESLRALESMPVISHQKASDTLGYTPRPLFQTITDLYAWQLQQNHPSTSGYAKSVQEKLMAMEVGLQ